MKAAFFTALRQIELQEVPEPKLVQPDDVLLRIDRVGVCGSDVHYYTHGNVGPQWLTYPAPVGHECSGTVLEVGPAVNGLRPGDRVAVDPAIVCGKCDQCRAGRLNTCRNIRFMGCPNQAPGALAEYSVMPAENCLVLPESISLDEGALLEPLSIGLHAVRLGEVYPAARVAVLGAGPIGLSVLACAKAAAPCSIYVTDPLEYRLEAARQCGADWTGNPRQTDVAGEILQRDPWGLDLVFECSGDPACIDQAQELLTPGGTLVMVGIPEDLSVRFDVHAMRVKELTFKNVRRQKGCLAPIIRLVAERQIDTRPLLTHRFSLSEVREAFELVAGYRAGVIKALIDLSQVP
jgi:L-iditol 2-dehydrogenase